MARGSSSNVGRVKVAVRGGKPVVIFGVVNAHLKPL